MAKKKTKLSKNEKKAAKAGVSVKEYNAAKKKNSSKSSKSSKNSDDFKQALKDRGAWDYYNNLSADQQELVRYNFETGRADNKDSAKKLAESLDEATKQADPYWKSFLEIARDETIRAFSDTENEYKFQKDQLETKIAQISEDLVKNRDFYTLEQQSDLAKLKQSYEQQRDGVIEDAASKGLTFSTKREVPLKQLSEYNTNVVESTNRSYNKKLEDITTESNRGIQDAASRIAALDTEKKAKLTDVGREAEQKLGTENLPTLEGYSALGNISGDYYENKVKDIEARKQAIFNEKTQNSLNF